MKCLHYVWHRRLVVVVFTNVLSWQSGGFRSDRPQWSVQLMNQLSRPAEGQQNHKTVLVCPDRPHKDTDSHSITQTIFLSLMLLFYLEHLITLKHYAAHLVCMSSSDSGFVLEPGRYRESDNMPNMCLCCCLSVRQRWERQKERNER